MSSRVAFAPIAFCNPANVGTVSNEQWSIETHLFSYLLDSFDGGFFTCVVHSGVTWSKIGGDESNKGYEQQADDTEEESES